MYSHVFFKIKLKNISDLSSIATESRKKAWAQLALELCYSGRTFSDFQGQTECAQGVLGTWQSPSASWQLSQPHETANVSMCFI